MLYVALVWRIWRGFSACLQGSVLCCTYQVLKMCVRRKNAVFSAVNVGRNYRRVLALYRPRYDIPGAIEDNKRLRSLSMGGMLEMFETLHQQKCICQMRLYLKPSVIKVLRIDIGHFIRRVSLARLSDKAWHVAKNNKCSTSNTAAAPLKTTRTALLQREGAS